jgi:hypothetical protein
MQSMQSIQILPMNQCNYCRDTEIVPYKSINLIITKYINILENPSKYKKYQIDQTINTLITMIRMSFAINKYISSNHRNLYAKYFKNMSPVNNNPETANLLRIGFLHDRPDTQTSTMIRCDYCSKETCEFHLRNFSFSKCNCNNKYSICGWCKELHYSDNTQIKCYSCFDQPIKKLTKIPLKRPTNILEWSDNKSYAYNMNKLLNIYL